MKILVLNGSPKREKSDTLHLTNAFLTGMKDFAEQEVHIQMMFPNNTTMLNVPESPMFNAPEAEIVTSPFLELVRQT